MLTNKVGVIIPNWNGWKDTIECLESLIQSDKNIEFDIIVVDNASTDDSLNKIKQWGLHYFSMDAFYFSTLEDITIKKSDVNKFILIKNTENKGFAAALNVGAEFAIKQQDYKYLWFLNNDTKVDKYAIKELVDYISNKHKIGMLGNLIMEYNDPDIIQCMGGSKYNIFTSINTPYLKGHEMFEGENIHNYDDNKSKGISYICGASMFIPLDVFQDVGYFNEEYFLYYEELDYTRRLDSRGYGIDFTDRSIIYHKGGSSAGSESSYNKNKSYMSEYYSNLSALKFTKTFHPKIFPFFFISRFFMKTGYLLLKKRVKLMKALVRAYYDFMFSTKA